jgi:hypothetical protein
MSSVSDTPTCGIKRRRWFKVFPQEIFKVNLYPKPDNTSICSSNYSGASLMIFGEGYLVPFAPHITYARVIRALEGCLAYPL